MHSSAWIDGRKRAAGRGRSDRSQSVPRLPASPRKLTGIVEDEGTEQFAMNRKVPFLHFCGPSDLDATVSAGARRPCPRARR